MSKGRKEGVLLVALAAALGALFYCKARARAVPPPPPLSCPSCMFSGAAEQQVRARAEAQVLAWASQLGHAAAEVGDAVAVEDPDAIDVAAVELEELNDPLFLADGWIAARRAEGATFSATFAPSYALASGVVGRLELFAHSVHGRLSNVFPEAFVETSRRAVWSSPPREAFDETASDRVDVIARFDPARRWMSAEASVELRRHRSPTAVLDFSIARVSPERAAAAVPDALASYAGSGVDVESVTLEGRPLRFALGNQQLAVRLPQGEQKQRLQVRYRGEPRSADTFFAAGAAYLRDWFPQLVASTPELRLTMVVPDAYYILGMGTPDSVSRAGGWTTYQWQLPHGRPAPSAMLLPHAMLRRELRFPSGGDEDSVVRLHGHDDPLLPVYLEAARVALARAGLPFPAELDVVLADHDAAGDKLVVLSRDRAFAYHTAAAKWLVAKLVAEQWFGQQIYSYEEGATPLTAVLSGTIGLLGLTEAERLEMVRQLATHEASAGATPLNATSAMRRDRGDAMVPRGIRVLMALAERLGEARFNRVLRRLLDGGHRVSAGWMDLELAVREVATLEDWLRLRTELAAPRSEP